VRSRNKEINSSFVKICFLPFFKKGLSLDRGWNIDDIMRVWRTCLIESIGEYYQGFLD
jgi:hypothetical protein